MLYVPGTNSSNTNLPNLLELLFLIVLLLPSASRRGLHDRMTSYSLEVSESREVKNRIDNLVYSVLPAPLSPEMTMD